MSSNLVTSYMSHSAELSKSKGVRLSLTPVGWAPDAASLSACSGRQIARVQGHTGWSIGHAMFLRAVSVVVRIHCPFEPTDSHTGALVDGAVARNGTLLGRIALGSLGRYFVVCHVVCYGSKIGKD